MKKDNLEVILAVLLASFSWFIHHYTEIIGGFVITVALAVWVLRLRREWRARNQKPDND